MSTPTDADRARRALYRAVILAEPVQAVLQARHGLRLADIWTLRRLRDHGPTPMSQFAALLGIPRSTATGVVDRLAERGVAERLVHPTDRRTTLVRIAARGLAILDDRALFRQGPIAERIDALEPTQQRQLAELLELLTGNDDTPAPEPMMSAQDAAARMEEAPAPPCPNEHRCQKSRPTRGDDFSATE